ncbi:hypothetical protein [Kitasatospora aureofaciens]|nr:hypothetical protein [Kitasatospora aureofaciens]
MAVTIVPTPVAACSAFTATATGAPVGAVTAVFFYDGAAPQSLPVVAGAAGPATFTAVGSGAQLVLVTYLNAVAAVVGTDSGTVTVNAAPAGTISTTLSIGVGGLVTAQTTLTCSAGLTSVNGTLTYTLPGGGTVTAPVVNGVVGPASLGLALTAGQLVGVSFTPAAGTCAACTFAPITVTVPAPLACSVVVIQPVAPVVVGQPTVVSAVVLCNGVPVAGAAVTFNGDGAAPVTVTTNALGIASGSMTFPTAGPVSLTATVTAAGTTCTCTNVVSLPVTVTVTPPATCQVFLLPPVAPVVVGQPTVVSAVVLCNGVPVAGAAVTFNGGGAAPVTVTTNALGIASGSMTFPTAGPVSLTATVTAAGTTCTCTNVVSLPVTVTVTPPATCQVFLLPPVAPVVVGQPTVVSAVVLCNGVPVAGAAVTFNGDGAAPVTVTTNALGIASGSMTFPTAGPVSLTATVTAAGTTCTCTNVVSLPVTVTVTPPATCQVFLLPPVAPVVVGQPTVVSAVVLCNGVPVAGAAVTFNGGGAAPVTVTTNALGIASGSMTFPTAGPVSLTATVTAAGTTCTCTNVVSLPVPITVGVGGPAVSLQALPSCWQGHWEHAPATPSHGQPYPFTATLKAQLTPAAAGVTVNFLVAGQPVGSAVTDASGIAILTTDLNLLQVQSGAFTATATVGGTPLQSTGTLLPCRPL